MTVDITHSNKTLIGEKFSKYLSPQSLVLLLLIINDFHQAYLTKIDFMKKLHKPKENVAKIVNLNRVLK